MPDPSHPRQDLEEARADHREGATGPLGGAPAGSGPVGAGSDPAPTGRAEPDAFQDPAQDPVQGAAQTAPETALLPPPALWGAGASLGLGFGLLLAYLLFQYLAMTGLAVVDVLLRGDGLTLPAMEAHLRARMGWLFSVATLLAAPAACLLAVAWTAAGARRRGLEGAARRSAVRRHLGLVRPGWRGVLLWLAVTVALLAVYEVAARALERPPLPDFMVEFYATGSPLLLALAVVVGAPLAEEVIFRGFLLPGLAAGRVGPLGAVVLTALLWALIHGQYDLFDMSAVLALGLAFGAARHHTGSLWPPLLLHAAVNALAMAQVQIALG